MPDAVQPTAQRTFPRTAACLPEIFAFMDQFFTAAGVGDQHRIPMQFAVEELFTNLVKYSKGGSKDILIDLKREAGRLAVSLTGFNVPRFDIRDVPDVDVSRDITDRKPGGLGIHLLKRMVDDVVYDYVEGNSTTTFFRRLE